MLLQNTDTSSFVQQTAILKQNPSINENTGFISIVDSKETYKKQPQQRVKNYLILYNQMLGEGSFSQVYKAIVVKQNNLISQSQIKRQNNLQYQQKKNYFQLQKQELVAIKIILKSMVTQDLKKLLESQMTILKIIKHENVVKCLDIFQDQSRIFIVTQLCNQGDLEKRIDTKGKIEEKQAMTIIKDVFEGLKYLNSLNIIHRDLKIANIFMHNGKAKIADFGFAIINNKRKSFQDINIGSPIYMSPQGIKHHMYGPSTDVWSFGVMIYQLLHGKTPFSHCKKQKQLKYNISVQIGWNSMSPSLSYGIKQIIVKCLQVSYQKGITIQQLSQFQIFKKQISLPNQNENLIKRKQVQRNRLKLKLNQEGNVKKIQKQQLNQQKNQVKQNYLKYQKQVNSLHFNYVKNQNQSKNKLDLTERFQLKVNKQKHYPIRRITSKTQFSNLNQQKDQTQKAYFIKKYQKNAYKTTKQNYRQFIQGKPKQKRIMSPSFSFKVKTQLNTSPIPIFQEKYQSFIQNQQILKFKMKPSKQMVVSQNLKGRFHIQQSSISPKATCQEKNCQTKISSVQRVQFNFPSDNISFYLFLIHFSRLNFKISGLHLQLTKDVNVQRFLLSTCIFILQNIWYKICNFLSSRSQIQEKGLKQLNLVKKTIEKYINQYKFHHKSNNFFTSSQIEAQMQRTTQKLQKQCEFCIEDLISKKKYNKIENTNRSYLKLKFLVLHQGFKLSIDQVKLMIFSKINKNQENIKKNCFTNYQINNLIRNLQKNIQDSQNKNFDIAKYLKMRKDTPKNYYNLAKFT